MPTPLRLFVPRALAAGYIAFALTALVAGPAAAQSGALSGRVQDAASGESLPYVSVAVWAEGALVTGAMSADDGAFRVEGVPAGAYDVVVSYVGFETERREGVRVGGAVGDVDLGVIALAPDVATLDDVDVVAERPRVQFQADRTVYNVADDPIVAGGSTTDALETIPSVEVDADGNLSLRGAGNVAVLINGRPAPVSRDFLGAYLRQLPAGAVERIEVIPNPSAAYDPEGMGGIINIVLKRNTDLGLGGGVTAGFDTRGGYNTTLNATLGRGPLNLAASYGFRHNERNSGGTRYRINRYLAPDAVTTLLQESDDARGGFSHLLNLSADYGLGRASTLSASTQAGLRTNDERGLTTYLERDFLTDDPTESFERLTEGGGDGWNADVRLGFRHDFAPSAPARGGRAAGEGASSGGGGRGGMRGGGGRGGSGGAASASSGHTLNVELRADASANADDEVFTERFTAGALRELQQTRSEEREREGSLRIDYARPLLGGRLEAGYDGEIEWTYSDFFSETDTTGSGVPVPDVGRNNTFEYEEQTHAVYTQLARAFGPASVQLGLRAEAARTTFTLTNTGEAYDNDYASLFPSGFLTYALSERDLLRASYSRRVGRVRTRMLNPFPRYDDPLNLSVGNPALKPQYVDAVELGYVRHMPWGSLTFTPYWRRTTDVVRRVQRVRDDGVTVSTFENLATSSSYGLETVLSFEVGGVLDGLRGYASVEGYRQMTDGVSADLDLTNDAFGWGGRLNLTYALRTGTDLQANLRYRAPMRSEQGSSGAMVFADLGLRQRLFGDRASLSIRARDPLGLMNWSSVIDEPTLYQEFERSMGGPQVGVTFTYLVGQRPRQRDRPETSGPEEGVDVGEPSFQ